MSGAGGIVSIPGLRTVSEANASRAGNWWDKSKRAKHQRATVAMFLSAQMGRRAIPAGPLDVTFTRVAPSAGLDDDNLRPALKAVRDGTADFLGLKSDRDPRVAWHYQQERGPWAVRITIAARASEPVDGPELHLELTDAEVSVLEEVFARREVAPVLRGAGTITLTTARRSL